MEKLKELNPLDKRKVDVAKERFEKAMAKADEERYRFASIVDAVIRSGYSMDSVLHHDEQNDLLDWKQEYEIEMQAQAAVAAQRFAQTDAIRAARKSK